MEDRVHNLKFYFERSMRYHEKRVAHYTFADKAFTAISLLAASAAVVQLTADNPGGILLSVVVALASVASLLVQPAVMAALHARLRQQFNDLAEQVSVAKPLSEAQLAAIERQRMQIERDEPPVYRALDLICHNEVCKAWGRCDPANLYRLPWYMEMFPQLRRWNTNSVPSEAELQPAAKQAEVPR